MRSSSCGVCVGDGSRRLRLRPGWTLLLGVLLAHSPRIAAGARPADGMTDVRVCTTPTAVQSALAMVPDDAGGMLIAWVDGRDGASTDIYVQHLLGAQEVDPVWPVDGVPVCTAEGVQTAVAMARDGAGGAIITWTDFREGCDEICILTIYSQHVLASGRVDPHWPANGRRMTPDRLASGQVITDDGMGGAIVAYLSDSDVYAQHIMASGELDPGWPEGGRVVCGAPGFQWEPKIVSDGGGGAIVVWHDDRAHVLPAGGRTAIYAQHVLASGDLDPAGPRDGSVVCTTPTYESAVIQDGQGGGDCRLAIQSTAG